MWVRALLILGVLAGIILGSQWAVARIEARGYEAGYAAAQSKCDALMRELDAREAANLAEHRRQQTALVQQSERAYAQYQQDLSNATAATDRLRAERDRLRDDVRRRADAINAVPVPGANSHTADTGRAAHTRALELLGECGAAYAGMAAEADRLRIKVTGLQAWAESIRNTTENPQ